MFHVLLSESYVTLADKQVMSFCRKREMARECKVARLCFDLPVCAPKTLPVFRAHSRCEVEGLAAGAGEAAGEARADDRC